MIECCLCRVLLILLELESQWLEMPQQVPNPREVNFLHYSLTLAVISSEMERSLLIFQPSFFVNCELNFSFLLKQVSDKEREKKLEIFPPQVV